MFIHVISIPICMYKRRFILKNVLLLMACLKNTTDMLYTQANTLIGVLPLTNRVRGPYWTKFLALQFMAQAQSAWAINNRRKNRDP